MKDKITFRYKELPVQVLVHRGNPNEPLSFYGDIDEDEYDEIYISYDYDVDIDDVIEQISYLMDDDGTTDELFGKNEQLDIDEYIRDNFNSLLEKYKKALADAFEMYATEEAQEVFDSERMNRD